MSNRTNDDRPSFRDLIAERHSRRTFLAGAAAAGLGAAGVPGFVGSLFSGEAVAQGAASSLGFSELKRIYDENHHVAPTAIDADVVVAWGDPLTGGAGGLRAATARRRRPGEALRLQLRLHRLHAAAASGSTNSRPRPAMRQQRIYLAAMSCSQGLTEDERRQGDERANRSISAWPPWAIRSSRSAKGRQMVDRRRTARSTAASPPDTEMTDLRPGRRPCADEDLGRPDRHQRARHQLQLQRRRHARGAPC